MFHHDFAQEVIRLHQGANSGVRTWPWTLLTFLSNHGWLYVVLVDGRVVKLHVPHGGAVLFRGDVLHGGAAYDEWHLRAHWYLVPKVSDYQGVMQDVQQWRVNADNEVALHTTDPWGEWSAKDPSKEPDPMCIFTPCLLSMEELLSENMGLYLSY